MKPEPFDIASLREVLEAQRVLDDAEAPNVLTAREIGEKMNISYKQTIALLHTLAGEGRIKPVRKASIDLCGRKTSTPAYEITL